MFRIGYGEDIHVLKEGRKLYLGGLLINDQIGCIAHSDGDVLLHSIVDALLGAMSLGDIGDYFSDKDPQYKDKASIFFIQKALEFLEENQFEIENIDTLIVLENIKLFDKKIAIKNNLAKILKISPNQVNVKAGTNEKMDAVGSGKCIIAKTVVLLRKKA